MEVLHTDQVASLLEEAAKLRAAAEELEADRRERLLLERRRWFGIFDEDRSGAVDAAEIRRGMKEFNGMELDSAKAVALLQAHDSNKNGVLELDEFDPASFEATLERLWAEDRAREEAAQREERERLAKLQEERELQEYYSTLPGTNTDTGPSTRAASVLAYLLPLLDSLRFGLPVIALFPMLQPVFTFLLPALHIMNVIPLGQFVVFIAMQTVAANAELPALLRFNVKQAIVLDVAMFLPNLLAFLINWVSGGDLAPEFEAFAGALVFLPMLACVAYAVLCTLGGAAPRGIPAISEAAERSLGMRPPHVGGSSDRE